MITIDSRALAHILNALLPVMVAGISPSNTKMRERSTQYLEELFFLSLQSLRPNIFVEIGAHEASASCNVQLQEYSEAVYAFEANPYTHREMIQKNVALTGTKIRYMNLGVTNFIGHTSIKIPSKDGKTPGHSSLLYRSHQEEYEEIQIPCTTIDNYFVTRLKHTDRLALWIDVEGLAYQVLGAGIETMRKVDILYVEVEEEKYWKDQELSASVIALMLEQGFLPWARDRGANQHNIIFLRYGLEEQLKNIQMEYLYKSMHLPSEFETEQV